MQQGTPKFP